MSKQVIAHIKKTHKKVKKRRSARSNLNIFLMFVAMVVIRRGIWHLLDAYFIPQHYFLNAILPLLAGLIYLLLDDRKLKELI